MKHLPKANMKQCYALWCAHCVCNDAMFAEIISEATPSGVADIISETTSFAEVKHHWKKHLLLQVLFSGGDGGDRGGKPLAFASQISPILCPSCSAKAYRTRWTIGSIPLLLNQNNKEWQKPLFIIWWRRWGSNPWPLDCQSNALPAELRPRIWLMK